jgi:hypothetical protein
VPAHQASITTNSHTHHPVQDVATVTRDTTHASTVLAKHFDPSSLQSSTCTIQQMQHELPGQKQ